jgi:hypothetical protein
MKRALLALASLVAFAFAPAVAFSQEAALRLVLRGYDPVAYFTEGKPVKGDPSFRYDWDDGRYQFANAKHRDMFAAAPDRYAPQFGGYCTGSMSRAVQNEGDPDAWIIRDGKLYVFGDVKFKEIAERDATYLPSKIPDATRNWAARKARPS